MYSTAAGQLSYPVAEAAAPPDEQLPPMPTMSKNAIFATYHHLRTRRRRTASQTGAPPLLPEPAIPNPSVAAPEEKPLPPPILKKTTAYKDEPVATVRPLQPDYSVFEPKKRSKIRELKERASQAFDRPNKDKDSLPPSPKYTKMSTRTATRQSRASQQQLRVPAVMDDTPVIVDYFGGPPSEVSHYDPPDEPKSTQNRTYITRPKNKPKKKTTDPYEFYMNHFYRGHTDVVNLADDDDESEGRPALRYPANNIIPDVDTTDFRKLGSKASQQMPRPGGGDGIRGPSPFFIRTATPKSKSRSKSHRTEEDDDDLIKRLMGDEQPAAAPPAPSEHLTSPSIASGGETDFQSAISRGSTGFDYLDRHVSIPSPEDPRYGGARESMRSSGRYQDGDARPEKPGLLESGMNFIKHLGQGNKSISKRGAMPSPMSYRRDDMMDDRYSTQIKPPAYGSIYGGGASSMRRPPSYPRSYHQGYGPGFSQAMLYRYGNPTARFLAELLSSVAMILNLAVQWFQIVWRESTYWPPILQLPFYGVILLVIVWSAHWLQSMLGMMLPQGSSK